MLHVAQLNKEMCLFIITIHDIILFELLKKDELVVEVEFVSVAHEPDDVLIEFIEPKPVDRDLNKISFLTYRCVQNIYSTLCIFKYKKETHREFFKPRQIFTAYLYTIFYGKKFVNCPLKQCNTTTS